MKKRDSLKADVVGMRLDQFLAQRRPDASRGHWKTLIEAGVVAVDGAPRAADYRLKGDETIVVTALDGGWARGEELEKWVVHEDDDLLVLDKPTGLLMHPLGGTWLNTPEAALSEREPNLAGFLQAARPGLVKVPRVGIAHRLDRQTSGVLLVAKTSRAHRRLLADFKERRIQKIYRALVRGVPAQKSARVQAPIGRKPGHRKILVTPFGKSAETSFSLVESCPGAAIVEARPLTGRTHQIRAHLGLIGHAVAGDVEFEAPGASPAAPRMLLHAFKISLTHPGTGKPVSYTAPLPRDFKEFWKRCGAVK